MVVHGIAWQDVEPPLLCLFRATGSGSERMLASFGLKREKSAKRAVARKTFTID
jgi:hypothetical protein